MTIEIRFYRGLEIYPLVFARRRIELPPEFRLPAGRV